MADQALLDVLAAVGAGIDTLIGNVNRMGDDVQSMSQDVNALVEAVKSAIADGKPLDQAIVDAATALKAKMDDAVKNAADAVKNADAARQAADQAALTTAPPSAPLPNPPAETGDKSVV